MKKIYLMACYTPMLIISKKEIRKVVQWKLYLLQRFGKNAIGTRNERFNNIFYFSTAKAQNAAIAAISYPRYKTKGFACVPGEEQLMLNNLFKAKEMFANAESNSTITNLKKGWSLFQFDSAFSDTYETVCRIWSQRQIW